MIEPEPQPTRSPYDHIQAASISDALAEAREHPGQFVDLPAAATVEGVQE